MAKRERGVSINPEDFSKGGVLNDVDVEFVETRFMTGEDAAELCDNLDKYTNYEETLFLVVKLKTQDGEAYEPWSSGKLDYFEPRMEGRIAKPVGTAEKLSDSCNAYTLLASILNAGFPRDQFDDDVSIFDGMMAHLIRVEQPKRAGLDGDSGKTRTVLTVENIHEDSPVGVPGKKRGRKAKPKAVAKASEGEDDFDEIASTTIVEILIDADGGPVKRTSLFGRMLKVLQKSHPDDFKDIIKVASEEDFLERSNDWDFDGKALSIGD